MYTQDYQDLSPDDQALLAAAWQAQGAAYAPYSRFPVGAALLSADGRIFIGCNVENASYGLTCCAERTALFSAVAVGVRRFVAVAVVAGMPGGRPTAPCGACRQVLSEFSPPFRVLLAPPGGRGPVVLTSVDELLPAAFSFGVAE